MERITAADIDEMRARGFDRSTIAQAEALLALGDLGADELAILVTSAFDGVTLDGGIGLREANAIDDYAGPEERRKVRALDETEDWRRIPAELLRQCEAAPSFLDAKGLRFHLPAFLVAELQGDVNVGFLDRLIFNSFTAPEFVKLLTTEQRHAVMACISFCGTLPESEGYSHRSIEAAMMRYA